MGGTSLRPALLVHPADEAVAGDQHALADMQGREVLAVQEVVRVGAGDVQHARQLCGVEDKGQIAEGIGGNGFGSHGQASSLTVQIHIQLKRYMVIVQCSFTRPPLSGAIVSLQIFDDLDGHALNDAAVHDDVLIAVVFGMQANVILFRAEAFERRLVAHQRHDDLIVVGRAPLADQDEIAVLDPCAGHGIALRAEQEELAPAEEALRQTDVFLDVLLRKLGDTAGHRAEDRHIEHVQIALALLRRDVAVAVVVQHPVFAHVGQILGNSAHGKAHTRRDLSDGGRGPLPVAETVDVVLDHGAILRFFVLHGSPPFS